MQFLPDRIRAYLNERGIDDTVLENNRITWDGERIVIPIFNADGVWLFNKYRRDPAKSNGPKYTYDKGSEATLYGADHIAAAEQAIITEGEFDKLVLEALGYHSVCSTGGAGTFKAEWIEMMQGKELFVCFDNDEAGFKGVERITRMHPEVRWIPLPPDVGHHGDITDFFVKLKKTKRDFDILMKVAAPLQLPPEPKPTPTKRRNTETSNKIERAKGIPLDEILEFNRAGFATCPFHNEKTPSLHWIKKSNRWYCFGCSEKGDGIDLIMKLHGYEKMHDAINHLLGL